MKFKIIRTLDKFDFENTLEELYKNNDVHDVQTHTESMIVQNKLLIYYIAIVRYTEIKEN